MGSLTQAKTVLPYRGQKYYQLKLNGVARKLPLIRASADTWIAYFDSLGEADFINHCADSLATYLKGCDVLMTSESKGIALVHQIAFRLKHDSYIVCRKERKAFMLDPIIEMYKPVTSRKKLELCIDGRYVVKIRGKRVGLVDDIVSTRATVDAMESIVKRAGGRVTKRAAILVEGAIYQDIFSLGVLPIFKKP